MQKKNKRREAAFVFQASINEQTAYEVGDKARKREFASITKQKKNKRREAAFGGKLEKGRNNSHTSYYPDTVRV